MDKKITRRIALILFVLMLMNNMVGFAQGLASSISRDKKIRINSVIRDMTEDESGVSSNKELESYTLEVEGDFNELLLLKLDSFKKHKYLIVLESELEGEKTLDEILKENPGFDYYTTEEIITANFQQNLHQYKLVSIGKNTIEYKLNIEEPGSTINLQPVEIPVYKNKYYKEDKEEDEGEKYSNKGNASLSLDDGYFTGSSGKMSFENIENIAIPTEKDKSKLKDYIKNKDNPIVTSKEDKKNKYDFKLVAYRRASEEDKLISEKEYDFINLIGLDKYVFLREIDKEIEAFKEADNIDIGENSSKIESEFKEKFDKLKAYPFRYEYKDGKLTITYTGKAEKLPGEDEIDQTSQDFVKKSGEDLVVLVQTPEGETGGTREVTSGEDKEKEKVIEALRLNPLGGSFVSDILRGTYNIEKIKYEQEKKRLELEGKIDGNRRVIRELNNTIDENEMLSSIRDKYEGVKYKYISPNSESLTPRTEGFSLNYKVESYKDRKKLIDVYYRGEEISQLGDLKSDNEGDLFNKLESKEGTFIKEGFAVKDELDEIIKEIVRKNNENNTKGNIKDASEKILENMDKITSLNKDIKDLKGKIEPFKDVVEKIGKVDESLKEKIADDLSLIKDGKVNEDSIDVVIGKVRAASIENKQDKEELIGLLESLKGEVGKLEDKEINIGEYKSAESELKTAKDDLKTAENKLNAAESELKTAENKLNEGLENDEKLNLDKIRKSEEQMDDDEKRLWDLRGRPRLEEEIKHLNAFAENYARLLVLYDEDEVNEIYVEQIIGLLEQLEDSRARLELYKMQKDKHELDHKYDDNKTDLDKIKALKTILENAKENLLGAINTKYIFGNKSLIGDFLEEDFEAITAWDEDNLNKYKKDYKVKVEGEEKNLDLKTQGKKILGIIGEIDKLDKEKNNIESEISSLNEAIQGLELAIEGMEEGDEKEEKENELAAKNKEKEDKENELAAKNKEKEDKENELLIKQGKINESLETAKDLQDEIKVIELGPEDEKISKTRDDVELDKKKANVGEELKDINESLEIYNIEIWKEIEKIGKLQEVTGLNTGSLSWGEAFRLIYHIADNNIPVGDEDEIASNTQEIYKFFNLPWIGITDVPEGFTDYEEVDIDHISGMYEKSRNETNAGNYWMFNNTVSWDGEKVTDKQIKTRIPEGSKLLITGDLIRKELEEKPPFVNKKQPFRLKLAYVKIDDDIVWRSELENEDISKEGPNYRLENGELSITARKYGSETLGELEEIIEVIETAFTNNDLDSLATSIDEILAGADEGTREIYKKAVKTSEEARLEGNKYNTILGVLKEAKDKINTNNPKTKIKLVFEDELNEEYFISYKAGQNDILDPVRIKRIKGSDVIVKGPEIIEGRDGKKYKLVGASPEYKKDGKIYAKLDAKSGENEIVFSYEKYTDGEEPSAYIPGYYKEYGKFKKIQEATDLEKEEKNNQSKLGKNDASSPFTRFHIETRDLDVCKKPGCTIPSHKNPRIGYKINQAFSSEFYNSRTEEFNMELDEHIKKIKDSKKPFKGYSIEYGSVPKGDSRTPFELDENRSIKVDPKDANGKTYKDVYIVLYYEHELNHYYTEKTNKATVSHDYKYDEAYKDNSHKFEIEGKRTSGLDLSITIRNDIYVFWDGFNKEYDQPTNDLEKPLDGLRAVIVEDNVSKVLYLDEGTKVNGDGNIVDEAGNILYEPSAENPNEFEGIEATNIDFSKEESWKDIGKVTVRPGDEKNHKFIYYFKEGTELPNTKPEDKKYRVDFLDVNDVQNPPRAFASVTKEAPFGTEINVKGSKALFDVSGIKDKDYKYLYSEPKDKFIILGEDEDKDKDEDKNLIKHYYFDNNQYKIVSFDSNSGTYLQAYKELGDNEYWGSHKDNGFDGSKDIKSYLIKKYGKIEAGYIPKSPEDILRSRYRLEGWSKSKNGSIVEDLEDKEITDNTVLYASWQPAKSTLIFDPNGGRFAPGVTTGAGGTLKEDIDLTEEVNGEYLVDDQGMRDLTKLIPEDPTRADGRKFLGWTRIGSDKKAKVANIVRDTNGEEYLQEDEIIIRAIWESPEEPDNNGGNSGGGGGNSGGGGGGNTKPDPQPEEKPDKPDEIIPHLPSTPEEQDKTDKYKDGDRTHRDDLMGVIIEEKIEYDLNKIDHLAYLKGYKDNTVRPEGNITREEAAMVFYRLMEPEFREKVETTDHNFTDVEAGRWSEKAIATLANSGMITGYGDGSFKPSQEITRAEISSMIAKLTDTIILPTDFDDIVEHWAEDYINSIGRQGWIKGYKDGSFKPNELIKRSEFTTMVNSILERQVKKENILEGIKTFKDLEENKWYYEQMVEASNGHKYIIEDGIEIWTELDNRDFE